MGISDELRQRARDAVIRGAEWMAASQVSHEWPFWTADAGRFLALARVDGRNERPIYTICWNTARGAQALLSAHTLTGDERYLAGARLAGEYVKTCQLFSPEYARHAGACLEETALADHIASRDTVEAVQCFVNLYGITKEPIWLERARAGADWLADRFIPTHYPNGYIMIREDDRGDVSNDFSRLMLAAMALPLAQLDALIGEERYAASIPAVLDWVVDVAIEPDGAMKIHDGTDAGHHAVASGELAGCFTNDDGVGVALLAAHRVTGDARYREAAERNGGWWRRMKRLPDTYASIPAGLNFMLDLHRFTGDDGYLETAAAYIDRVLELQDPGTGGFRGHEAACARSKKMWPGDPLDYVCLRTTMYAVMALAKLAAGPDGDWNMAYSAFGW